MARGDQLVDLELEFLGQTDAAYKVSDGDQEYWLPKSLTEWDNRKTFTLPEWLAIEKGLV